ncbi:MAG TPA: ABC transporter permease [Tepidisphaeraceae bacterium]|jgi:lipopolysaccharide transport system permease protein|nr:ABC transporter permease [Tepidisphaeraceae bacterium]
MTVADPILPEAPAEPPAKPFLKIRPSSGFAGVDLREMWQFRDLLLALAERDVKLRYKQTALGVVWVVLQPLLGAGIFTFVFGRVAKFDSDGVPYFLFSYAGLLGWNAFNSTLSKGSSVVVQNAQLVSKVYFPRLLLPLSTVASTLVDFAVAMGLMIVLMVFNHIKPGYPLLLLPVWLLLLVMLAAGIALFTSALMVSYRDLQYVIPILLQFLLYASPVAYSLKVVPERLRTIYMLNPLSGLLEAFRWSLLGAGHVHPGEIAYSIAMVFVIFLFGTFSFARMEQKFADVI